VSRAFSVSESVIPTTSKHQRLKQPSTVKELFIATHHLRCSHASSALASRHFIVLIAESPKEMLRLAEQSNSTIQPSGCKPLTWSSPFQAAIALCRRIDTSRRMKWSNYHSSSVDYISRTLLFTEDFVLRWQFTNKSKPASPQPRRLLFIFITNLHHHHH